MSFTFDQVDFVRFAPVALRLAIKKGFLSEHKKGNETSKSYYALVGNLMFIYEAEGDPSTLSGLLFLESSTVRMSNAMGFMALSISTVGGKTFVLSAPTNGELQEWMDAIESNKFLSMTRKLEDNEANSVQLVHRVEQQELVQQDYERSFVELKEQLKACEDKNQSLLAQLNALQAEQADLKKQLKSSENERLLLLKSRGITPKSVPLWALSENPREGVKEIVDKIKIWTGTWNLGSTEPFAGMDKGRAQRLLQPFIPPGYDVYVLGVQECVSDSIFECFDGLLVAEGCRKLRLDSTNIASALSAAASANAAVASDMSKLLGRGDGSLLSLKFTGIAIYVRLNLLGDARVLAVTNFPFTSVQSRGAVAAAISVFGRNMLFINCHLEAKNNEIRREQYTKLVVALGSQLAESGYHLTEQFHHVIWFGDLNYRLVDTSGNKMPVDTAIKLMEDGRLFRTLFETHDQLNQDKRNQLVFFGFREPTPFPNFYPTYKKLENRPPVDYTNTNWVKNTYRLHQKDPFFKGGKMQEKTPGFCDRILYHSMQDLVEDLVPESVAVDMNVYIRTKDDEALNGENASNIPKSMNVSIDNYRSVNDGEGLVSSDHSPVFGTFVLKLRHDYEKLLRESRNKKSVGNIHTVFTALSSSEQRAEALQSAAMYTTPTSSPQKAARPVSSGINRDPIVSNSGSALSKLIEENDGTSNDDGEEEVVINKVYKYSLLPHGVYRIRISDIKLVWGLNEDIPTAVAVLFPAPFEAEAGERFVGFHSEAPNEAANITSTSMSYSLPGYGDGLSSSPLKGSMARQMSPGSKPSTKMNKINTDFDASVSAARSTNPLAALGLEEALQWKKVGPSKTGTCLGLEVSQQSRGGSGAGGSSSIPPLQLVWRGDEPLDKLHVVMKATVCAAGISSTTVKKTNNRKSMSGAEAASLKEGPPDTFAEDEDSIVGHCAVGLEQLCKVAMVSSGGASGCISVSRLMINKGKPMYNIDPKTMQREMVTLTCQLELMPNI